MVDDRRRRSPEQRTRHAERMRVSRRIQANATGPDALLVQRSVREVYRDRQRRRRERLNAQCLVSDRVPLSPPVLLSLALSLFRSSVLCESKIVTDNVVVLSI